ncbi:MAG: zinc-ribbon domain-containing protein [Candidatus Methanoperedens sp.]|nr:zinc-ribbon domain-containing protein [Candidatus Methanoperedens sp.]
MRWVQLVIFIVFLSGIVESVSAAPTATLTSSSAVNLKTGESTTATFSVFNDNSFCSVTAYYSIDSVSYNNVIGRIGAKESKSISIKVSAPPIGSGSGSVQSQIYVRIVTDSSFWCGGEKYNRQLVLNINYDDSEFQNAKSNAERAISSANSAINSASSSIATAQNTLTVAKNNGVDLSNAEVLLTSAQTVYQNAQSKLGSAQNSFNQNAKQSFDLATQYANEATNYANSAKADADNAYVIATQAIEKYKKELPNVKSNAESAVFPSSSIINTAPSSIATALLSVVSGILLLTGVILLRRRKKSQHEVVLPSNELKNVPMTSQVSEQPKESPNKKSEGNVEIGVKSAYEYKGAKIYYKIKVENSTLEAIGDIKVHLFVPDVFLLKEKEKSLSMLEPKESKTVTFEIRPTGECGDCNVSGKVEYYDYSTKGRKMLDIETKSLSVICPVLKRKEIDIKQWEQVTDDLIKAEENIKELSVPAENLFNITSRVIKDSGMFMLKPEITSTPQLFNGIAMFYAEGVTGMRYAAYIEVVGGSRKSRLILKVWAEKEEALTGFYHRILDEIEKRIDVKIFIDDAVVQQHIHIGDRIGTQVKDSFVQRSNIGEGARKCPNCGREVETNEKFCLECGARL